MYLVILNMRMIIVTGVCFVQVSDTNAELVRLGNQVALLEEEKGNLQLSLVDFDELKGRNQDKRTTAGVFIDLVMLPDFYCNLCINLFFREIARFFRTSRFL